jgi:hemoglobin/transferrin/lactoferrin receptor protein
VRAVAALENVFDEDYRIHGSGYNQPGRNFKFSLEVRY